MQRHETTSKLFPNDPMGYDFTEYLTTAGNFDYITVVNKTLGTVYVTASLSSNALPF